MPARWERVSRHLKAHHFLTLNSAPGTLGLALLRNLQRLWSREVEFRLGATVMPASLKSHQVEDAATALAEVGRSFQLSPPLGLAVHAAKAAGAALLSPAELTSAGHQPAGQSGCVSSAGELTLWLAVPRHSVTQWHQTLQRTRRIWWRELAAEPGNFSLTRRTTDGAAEVCYGDGLVLEQMRDCGCVPLLNSGFGMLKQQVHLLSCSLNLDAALWAICADALDLSSPDDTQRCSTNNTSDCDAHTDGGSVGDVPAHGGSPSSARGGSGDPYCAQGASGAAMRLAERLTPYQRAVVMPPNASDELRALAVHLTNQLRLAGVPVFPPSLETDPERGSRSARTEDSAHGGDLAAAENVGESLGQDLSVAEAATMARTDAAGVPYCLLLSETTLETGVCRLRSRDTTLSHQLHVSQVTDVT